VVLQQHTPVAPEVFCWGISSAKSVLLVHQQTFCWRTRSAAGTSAAGGDRQESNPNRFGLRLVKVRKAGSRGPGHHRPLAKASGQQMIQLSRTQVYWP